MPIVEKEARNMGFDCVKLFRILTLNQLKQNKKVTKLLKF